MSYREIINKILQIKKCDEICKFELKNNLKMDTEKMQKYIFNLNKLDNINIYYNPRTNNADCISVLDVNGKRYIDFDDVYWDLMNKGIDVYTKKTIYD